MKFVKNYIVLAAGVMLAALIVPGIEFGENWNALLLVVLLLALFNAVLKPLLVLFTLPLVVLSLGLSLWLINGLLLYWSARIVDGFHVSGAFSALGGAFVISLTHILLSGFKVVTPEPPRSGHRKTSRLDDDDVIDV